MNWDDLRHVLTVAETGSLAAAARHLQVNHTTVLRRINALEARLGVRLFERLPTGYALTSAGSEAVAIAGQLSATVDTLERKLKGGDLKLSGPVRVTTTDSLALTILMPHLASFQAAHPGIALELAISNTMANLTRRDADIAIRPSADPPVTLVGRRIADIGFAVYGTAACRDPAAGPWIALDESLAATVAGRWARETLPRGAPIACRVDTLLAAREAVRAGMGLSLLPCYIADREPDLIRVQDPEQSSRSALWLLTHEDLRRTARIRAFIDYFARKLARDRDLIEGRPRPARPRHTRA